VVARQRGFTLLEAMVATVVLTMSLFATYSWVDVSIQMLIRSDEVMTQELLVSDFLEELDLIDLQKTQDGTLAREDLRLEWLATPIETKSGVNNRGIRGYWDHTLYRVEISIYRSSQLIASFDTRQVSSDQVREPRYEL
jgi:prepilin-type N-terminal cleavage/methylation domain-containing protein